MEKARRKRETMEKRSALFSCSTFILNVRQDYTFSKVYSTLTFMSFLSEWYTEQYLSCEREMARSSFFGVNPAPVTEMIISMDV
jgi:hypothetical protein